MTESLLDTESAYNLIQLQLCQLQQLQLQMQYFEL